MRGIVGGDNIKGEGTSEKSTTLDKNGQVFNKRQRKVFRECEKKQRRLNVTGKEKETFNFRGNEEQKNEEKDRQIKYKEKLYRKKRKRIVP